MKNVDFKSEFYEWKSKSMHVARKRQMTAVSQSESNRHE